MNLNHFSLDHTTTYYFSEIPARCHIACIPISILALLFDSLHYYSMQLSNLSTPSVVIYLVIIITVLFRFDFRTFKNDDLLIGILFFQVGLMIRCLPGEILNTMRKSGATEDQVGAILEGLLLQVAKGLGLNPPHLPLNRGHRYVLLFFKNSARDRCLAMNRVCAL